MGVSFNKTGILSASGSPVFPNLIAGNYSCITTNSSHSFTGSASVPGIADIIVANQGKILWFSYDYCTLGERNVNTGRSSTLGRRYGCHLSFRYYKTDGTLTNTMYPCTSSLELVGKGRTVMGYTLPTDIASVSNFSVAVQPYAGPAEGNPETWYIRNLKIEIGSPQATPWLPHTTDWGYVDGSQPGFIETGNLMRVYDGRIDTTEFIEY